MWGSEARSTRACSSSYSTLGRRFSWRRASSAGDEADQFEAEDDGDVDDDDVGSEKLGVSGC
jgi:hypothetical protein